MSFYGQLDSLGDNYSIGDCGTSAQPLGQQRTAFGGCLPRTLCLAMNLRKSEYLENELSARWLDAQRAKNAYNYALQFSSKDRYGLSEATVGAIEHVNIESYSVADAWLKDRLPAEGTVQVVYGDDEVCVIAASDFLANWQSIFVPARDDAIVLHNPGKGVLFYCHEEELEFGHRKA